MKRLMFIIMLMVPMALAAQGELYKEYAQRKELAVAEISGFKVNDTLKVDVVVMVAETPTAWERLKKDLDIRTSEGTTSWIADPKQPARRIKWNGRPFSKVIASHVRRTVAVYMLQNEAELDALLDYQINQTRPK